MSQEEGGPTPGASRIVTFHIGPHEFCLRRPTRGDEAEIRRRLVTKLLRAAPPMSDFVTQQTAQAILDSYDGGGLWAEARLEVLLAPRVVSGAPMKRGEKAPDHWFHDVRDADGKLTDRLVSFDDVPVEEFQLVAEKVAELLDEKKSDDSQPGSSTASAASPKSA